MTEREKELEQLKADLLRVVGLYFDLTEKKGKGPVLVEAINEFARQASLLLREEPEANSAVVNAVFARVRQIMEGLPRALDPHEVLRYCVTYLPQAFLAMIDQDQEPTSFATYSSISEDPTELDYPLYVPETDDER